MPSGKEFCSEGVVFRVFAVMYKNLHLEKEDLLARCLLLNWNSTTIGRYVYIVLAGGTLTWFLHETL